MKSGTWVQLGQHYYEIFEASKMNDKEFKNIDLKNNKICAAKNGGPIAITSNTEKYIFSTSEQMLKQNICFYSNQGNLILKVPFHNKVKIVCFEFIEDEFLLILLENGIYYIVCPHQVHKQIQTFDLGNRFKSDLITEGKIFENSLAFKTKQNQFFLVHNLKEPHKCKQFGDPKLKLAPRDWAVIPKNQTLSEKVEIQITHPEAGIILLVEDEGVKYYYNQYQIQNYAVQNLPHINNIIMISPSPNYSQIAYLSQIQQQNRTTWVCTILSSNFQDEQLQQIEVKQLQNILLYEQKHNPYNKDYTTLTQNQSPECMLWCGQESIIINTFYKYFMLREGCILEQSNPKKGQFFVQELDCARVISNRKQEFIRLIPDSYLAVFQDCSTEPGALLLDQYQQLENREPVDCEDTLRTDKTILAQAVEECILAASFEQNKEKQSTLLRAAVYGKTFLYQEDIDHNQLGEVCKYLRVMNSLKVERICRIMTYKQLTKIKDQLLIKLLLRYNQHYKAIEICKHLNFLNQLRQQIYIHWACQKVESDSNLDDTDLCQVIKQKLDKQNVSYTEIARRAIQVGKSSLALKLLELETSVAKKIPVLLWMGSYVTSNQQYSQDMKEVCENFQQPSINEIFQTFLRAGQIADADNIRKKHNISDKRYLVAKIKVLIEQKEWSQLYKFMDISNQKTVVIPYEMVADLVIQAGSLQEGIQLLLKMPNIEEQVSILIRIGQAKVAVDSAVFHKKPDLLMEIRQQVNDPEVLTYIDQYQSKGF